ncbi:hypothetical protein [Tardiphaga sp. 367_B4_N1_1]|uniref:hypothetical protein n=1 Tax=Tardiphaga sp. 367_B4_N1_1 TaxID=3240777 RepID=UPI003F1E6F7E
MLIITIDLVPGGYQSYRHTIGSMRIANLSNLADTSDYSIEVMEAANPLTGAKSRKAACAVRAHDRRQSVFALLAKACEAIMRAGFVEPQPSNRGVEDAGHS